MALDPAKHAFGFVDEFKKFMFKGNLIDMAVGVIIGGAFGKIVESLVKNVIMPFVGAVTTGGTGEVGDIFKSWSSKVNGVDIPWGSFVGDFINFVILGLVIFIVIVKFVGAIAKSKAEAPAAPPEPPADVKLLTEIRDLLSKK
jgi:large conductance mechanosensitive channel